MRAILPEKTRAETTYLPEPALGLWSSRILGIFGRLMSLRDRFALLALLFGLAAGLESGPARAAASAWGGDANARVRLVSATEATGTAARLDLGLEFNLAPGWHIYWRAPGDVGYPPSADWTGSDNLQAATLAWPAPHRYTLLGVDSIGYVGDVVLPVLATLAHPGAPLRLNAALDWLACSDICVPYQATLALDVPSGTAAPSAEAPLVARAAAAVPEAADQAGIVLDGASVLGPADQPRLALELTATPPLQVPDLFVEKLGRGFAGKPRVSRLDGGRSRLELPLYNITRSEVASAAATDGIALTLVDGARGAELIAHPTPAAGADDATQPGGRLAIVGIALLGGLILNLMPCVLPVLALKLAAVGGYGGAARRMIRLGFLASALGIVASFLLLAGAAIAVRAAGGAVGWGIQFQQPWFLVALIAILTLFAANQWDWLAIGLPRALADRLTSTPPGQNPDHNPDRNRAALAGAFATGMFATLLATPCSAPFVGTALGFALSRGPADIVGVFAALGIGLALPYLAVALAPGLVAWLPRPGGWMVGLRRVLGVALAGSAVWLIVVLAGGAGAPAALGVAAAMVALAALLALRAHGAVMRSRMIRRFAGIAALVLIGVAFAAPPLLATAPPRSAATAPHARWQPFAADRLAAATRAGHVVLVDVTADWCLTCKVNKALVLDRGAIAAALADGRVTGMRADWTRPDPAVADYLASFGRYGIPFDAVYGPGAPDGIALPELLTADAVREAVERAAGK
jgi:suppressor for copper-sensitivity B